MNLEPALTRLSNHAKAIFRPDWQHEPFTVPLGLQPVTIATDGKARFEVLEGGASP